MADGRAAGDKFFRNQSEPNLNASNTDYVSTCSAPTKRSIDEVLAPSHEGDDAGGHFGKIGLDRNRLSGPSDNLGSHTPKRRQNQDYPPSTRSLPSIAQLTGALDRSATTNSQFRPTWMEIPQPSEPVRLEFSKLDSPLPRHPLPSFLRQDAQVAQVGERSFSSLSRIPTLPHSYSADSVSELEARSRPKIRQERSDPSETLSPHHTPVQQQAPIESQAREGHSVLPGPTNSQNLTETPLRADTFRRDMRFVQDWTTRVYYLATGAAPGTGNEIPINLPNSQPIRVPSQAQYVTAIDQMRDTLAILERWREIEYGAPPPPMPGLRVTDNAGAQQDSTSSGGEGGLGNSDASFNQNVSLPVGKRTAWDQADTEAIKNRKRSAPKSLSIAGTSPASSKTPNETASGSSTARVASRGMCQSCKISETPEWRCGPDGARTLCNACGLHFAKMEKKKQQQQEAARQLPPPQTD